MCIVDINIFDAARDSAVKPVSVSKGNIFSEFVWEF